MANPSTKQRRVLIIGLSNIGDAILMSDIVAAAHGWDSRAHLTLVVGERATALFAGDPRIHTLVNADAYSSLLGRLKLAIALWRYQPHVVVDLRSTFYPFLLRPLGAWRYARRAPKHLVHMRERHWWKLSVQAPDLASAKPKLRYGEAGLASAKPKLRYGEAGLASAAKASRSSVWVSERDEAHIEGLWRRWNVSSARRLVIICPGARSHIKRWAAEGFAKVADRLIAELGSQVIFSGEPDEESVIESIRGEMQERAYSAVGLTTIRQLGALMQRAQLVITNDSASLHLASSLSVPTVAVFGPTDAKKYGPTAANSLAVHRRLFCAPCEQSLCRFNHECMRFVTADDVFGAARDLLRQAPSAIEQLK
jgi:ADP-heptose:LPS heptosyltransferase